MAAPSAITDSPAPLWHGRVKLLDANYSSDFYPVRVAEDGNTVRLEYHLPDRRKLWALCPVTTVCLGVLLVPCDVALLLLIPADTIAKVFFHGPAVALAVIIGTFGPALMLRWQFDRAVRQNPMLEWDRSRNRLSVHRGRITFNTAEVIGLVALTDPLVDEMPNRSQLQLLVRNSGGTHCELVGTSTKPANQVFVSALREFAARTGCPIWVGRAVEGRQGSKLEMRTLSEVPR